MKTSTDPNHKNLIESLLNVLQHPASPEVLQSLISQSQRQQEQAFEPEKLLCQLLDKSSSTSSSSSQQRDQAIDNEENISTSNSTSGESNSNVGASVDNGLGGLLASLSNVQQQQSQGELLQTLLANQQHVATPSDIEARSSDMSLGAFPQVMASLQLNSLGIPYASSPEPPLHSKPLQGNQKPKRERSTKPNTKKPTLQDRIRSSASTGSNSSANVDGPRRWLPEEDERLREAVAMFGDRRWKEIAAQVGTRDNVQCLQRWRKSLKPGLIKGPWREEEDALLREKVQQKKQDPSKTWTWVAQHINGRNAKQCRERWQNFLDDSIIKGGWSPEEDEKLFALHKQMQGSWAMIAREMPGRTENSVKVRYQSVSRLRMREATNTPNSTTSSPPVQVKQPPAAPPKSGWKSKKTSQVQVDTSRKPSSARAIERKAVSESSVSTISPASTFADTSAENAPFINPKTEKLKRKSDSGGSLEKKRRTSNNSLTFSSPGAHQLDGSHAFSSFSHCGAAAFQPPHLSAMSSIAPTTTTTSAATQKSISSGSRSEFSMFDHGSSIPLRSSSSSPSSHNQLPSLPALGVTRATSVPPSSMQMSMSIPFSISSSMEGSKSTSGNEPFSMTQPFVVSSVADASGQANQQQKQLEQQQQQHNFLRQLGFWSPKP